MANPHSIIIRSNQYLVTEARSAEVTKAFFLLSSEARNGWWLRATEIQVSNVDSLPCLGASRLGFSFLNEIGK